MPYTHEVFGLSTNVREYSYVDRDNLDKKIQSAQCNLQEDIDLPSFAKKFVIDELAINMDIGITSTYFYKKVNTSRNLQYLNK